MIGRAKWSYLCVGPQLGTPINFNPCRIFCLQLMWIILFFLGHWCGWLFWFMSLPLSLRERERWRQSQGWREWGTFTFTIVASSLSFSQCSICWLESLQEDLEEDPCPNWAHTSQPTTSHDDWTISATHIKMISTIISHPHYNGNLVKLGFTLWYARRICHWTYHHQVSCIYTNSQLVDHYLL